MSRHNRNRNLPDYAARNTTEPNTEPTSYKSYQFWIIFFFHLLLLTVPLFFTWVNEELFEFNKIILLYAYTLIIGGLWLGRMISQKKILWKRTFFDFPIAFFLISQLLSTLFSINFHTSIFGYYTRFNGGLLSTLSYIILYYAFINNVERRHLPKILFSTFLSALAVSLMAIPEHFGHSFSCLLIGVSRGNPASGSIYDTSCWIQDVQTRVFASFGQPNWLAAYAITLIPVGALLASGRLGQENRFKIPSWQKWFYLLTTLALFLTLIFTKSRSGFLGLGVGLFFATVIIVLKVMLNPAASFGKKSVAAFLGLQLVLAILAVAAFGSPYSPSISEFLSRKQAAPVAAAPLSDPAINRLDEGGTDSGEIRRIVWTGAIKVWERYPIFGSGVETFAYSYYKDRPLAHNLVSEWDFLYNKAHNEFLNFLATTGLVGLVTYVFLLAAIVFLPVLPTSTFVMLYQKKLSSANLGELEIHDQTSVFLFGVALSSGIVALSVSNFFGFSTVMVSLLLFLFPAIWFVFAQPKTDILLVDEPKKPELSMTQIVLLCLLFFITLALLFHVYGMWEADRIFASGKQNSEANQVNVGLPMLEQAVQILPDEPYFYEELAVTDARIAAALATNNNATAAAEFTQKSVDLSDQMIQMNDVNLNFYKSSARIYSLLAEVNPQFILKAISSLKKAHQLAPTDPKIMYNIAILELNTDQMDQGLKDLETAVEMKTNYIQARLSLAKEYESAGKTQAAKLQYEYILKNIQANDPTSLDRLQFIATSSAKVPPQK